MKVITDNKLIAMEVLSAQNLFNEDIDEIKIVSCGSQKYGINNYDAKIIIKDMEFMLYRDLDFKNVDIKTILKSDIPEIEYKIVSRLALI